MAVRTRVMQYPLTNGSYTPSYEPWPHNEIYYNGRKITVDDLDHPDGYFDVDDLHMSGGTVSGPYWSSAAGQTDGWRMYRYGSLFDLTHLPTEINLPPDVGVDILEKTNPSKPLLQLPVFAKELSEIPKNFLESLHKRRPPNGNLWYRFDFEATRQDLIKLFCVFPTAVGTTFNRIKRLRERGWDIKKIKYGKQKTSSRNRQVLNTFLIWCEALEQIETEQEIWGYCRWKTTFDPGIQTDSQLIADVKRSLLGLSFSNAPSAFYQALPWTWLFDWFTNVGSLLNATNNQFGAEPAAVCICTRTNTVLNTYDFKCLSTADVKFEPFVASYITKKRRRVFPHLAAQLPILSPDQLSILTSLIFH